MAFIESKGANGIAICADSLNVSHGFFGRKGGCSEGLYASLNCSAYVGDSDENVGKNLETVRNSFANAQKLITLKQVHSNICIEVSTETTGGIEADAMVTKERGIAIGILTADCAPVLFFDPTKAVIGAAHAGWRGAVGGVIEATVRKMMGMGCRPEDIRAAIGPCIGKNSYEIDDDFKKGFAGSGDCFVLVNYRLHFDLLKFCKKRLLNVGIVEGHIDVADIDTYANPEKYFSYRFANQNSSGICGRQISAICLE